MGWKREEENGKALWITHVQVKTTMIEGNNRGT
jgi:hypothetical protein